MKMHADTPGAVVLKAVQAPERLDFLTLRIRAQAQQGFVLDNPYSDLHGGFGLMLHAHLRPIFEDLFGEQQFGGEVRGYALRPGLALRQPVPAGGEFAFYLMLVGPAVRHAASCLEALSLLGLNGVTRARHRYDVFEVVACSPQGERVLWSPEQGWCVHALAPVSAADLLATQTGIDAVLVDFVSPLRIKHENRVLQHCPTPRVFFERLLGRLQMLATQQSGAPLISRDCKQALLESTKHLEVIRASLRWEALERYSARQRQSMESGGLSGTMLLSGPLGALEGWLRLGSWLHVGSKTSFGYGHFCCDVLSATPPQPV